MLSFAIAEDEVAIAGAWAGDDRDAQASVLHMLGCTRGEVQAVAGHGIVFAASGASQVFRDGDLSVVFDGRLYNCDDLAATLPLQGAPGSPSRECMLVAAAYRRWGLDMAAKLDGEFALALWDQGQRLLLLGRDAMGRGSLSFSRHRESVVFATDPQALFRWPGLTPVLDDESLAQTMTLRFVGGRTLFRGVRSPAQGHIFVASQGKPDRELRYWFPERAPMLKLRDTREYADAVYEAMERAVAVRIPQVGTVVSELSSGYDSSSVTALAARALAKSNRAAIAVTSVPARPVETDSIIRHSYADEWTPAARVAAMYPNVEHVAVRTDSAAWLSSLDAMTGILAAPPLFIRNVPWMYQVRRYAQQRGADLMLTGQNGNLAGSYDGGFALFDSLRRGDLARLAGTAMEWRRTGTGWKSLFLRAWMPTASTRARLRRLGWTAGRQDAHGGSSTFEQGSLFRREALLAAGVAPPPASLIGLPVEGDRRNGASRRLSIMQMVDFGVQYAGEERTFGYRRTDPTADRRLVELCLAIPDWAYCPGGRRRELYRQAMQGVLPPEILNEHRLGLQASDFLENFAAGMGEWQEEMDQLERSNAAAHYLDLPRMRQLLESFPERVAADRGLADQTYNYTFGGAVALGRFLRRVEDGSLFRTP